MTSPQEWITTIIIIIVTTKPMKTVTITRKTAQPTRMVPASTILPQLLPKTIQQIRNKRLWITTL